MVSTLETEGHCLYGEHQIPVYYDDTDLSGFVYHANYLKFFERAREHLIGIDYLKSLWLEGVHFVVSEANLRYMRPLRHGDRLFIKSHMNFSKSPVLHCEQQGLVQTSEGEVKVVQGRITLATLNKENRPIRLPQHVLEHFQKHPGHILKEE